MPLKRLLFTIRITLLIDIQDIDELQMNCLSYGRSERNCVVFTKIWAVPYYLAKKQINRATNKKKSSIQFSNLLLLYLTRFFISLCLTATVIYSFHNII